MKTQSFKLYPVYGTELVELRIKDDPKTYYRFATMKLNNLEELRHIIKHGVIQYA